MPNQSVGTQTAVGAGTEGGRRPTVVPAPTATNPEISGRPSRRTFTAPDKLRILKEADQAAGTGEIGAILRRHGLYSSALSEWRRQRDAGTLGALTPARRGPKSCPANPLAAELAVSKRQNALLRRRLERAEAIIEVQKNLPICWGSNWRRSRRRPSSTTHSDGWTGGLHAGQGCSYCDLRGTRLIPRQPASQRNQAIAAACSASVPTEPAQGVVVRAAENRARSAPFASLRRSGAGRNLRHLAR